MRMNVGVCVLGTSRYTQFASTSYSHLSTKVIPPQADEMEEMRLMVKLAGTAAGRKARRAERVRH